MEILRIFADNKRTKIEEKFIKEKDEILKADRYEITRRKCADLIDNLYKELNNGVSYYENHNKVFKWAEGKLQEKATLEKLGELEEKTDIEYCELEKLINEINAQLNMCETYEQKQNILKVYNVIDKNGILVK